MQYSWLVQCLVFITLFPSIPFIAAVSSIFLSKLLTDEVDVVYFALYWYFYFFGYEVFLMKYLLSILLKRICVRVSFMKILHTSGNMEEGAHRAIRKNTAATIQNPQKYDLFRKSDKLFLLKYSKQFFGI